MKGIHYVLDDLLELVYDCSKEDRLKIIEKIKDIKINLRSHDFHFGDAFVVEDSACILTTQEIEKIKQVIVLEIPSGNNKAVSIESKLLLSRN